MTDSTLTSDIDKLRAFEQRMQSEGAAGFADGLEPWDSWQESHSDGEKRVWESLQRSELSPAGKSHCEKLLSTMATVAVTTLAVGIGGIYLSTDTTPLIAANRVQPLPLQRDMTDDLSQPARVIRNRSTATGINSASVIHLPDLQSNQTEAAAMPAPVVAASSRTENPGNKPVNGEARGTMASRTVSSVATQPQTEMTAGKPDVTASMPATAAGPTPTVVFRQQPQATPADAAVKVASSDTQAAVDGIWVVNISSYNFASMAQRKLTEFKKKGVIAEVFPATVKGKTIYRIRATGYDTRAEATTWVTLLQDRLGVDSAWVSKR